MTEAPLEIERVYLLDRLPVLPPSTQAYQIEQGYLPDPEPDESCDELDFMAILEAAQVGAALIVEGRLRRTLRPDGTIKLTHTIKEGEGLVRKEIERDLEADEFEPLWKLTQGRRIKKTRHKVAAGDLVWEIDDFANLDLVMAEVELPTVEAESPIPAWLANRIVRELTEDPRYRNHALATIGLPKE